MAVFEHKSQKILIYDPDQARSTVSVFFSQYTHEGSESPCSVFIVSEIRTEEHRSNQLLIRDIQETLFNAFVSSHARMNDGVFEEGLQQVNTLLPSLIQERNPNFLEHVSMVAGTIAGNVIHFSQVGSMTLLFLHQGKIVDLAERGANEQINPLKFFSEIASGKLEETDAMFVATSNFLDYFSQEKIRRIIEENSSGSIAKAFDAYLMQAPLTSAFSGLYLGVAPGKIATVDEYVKQPEKQTLIRTGNRMRSIQELIERERSTDEIMSPRVWPQFKRTTLSVLRSIRLFFKKQVLRKPTRISPVILEREQEEIERQRETVRTPRHAMRKPLAATAHSIFSRSKEAASASFIKLKQAVQSRKVKHASQGLAPEVRTIERKRFNILHWFSSLSRQRKILFIILILLIAGFAQSMAVIATRNASNDRTNQNAETESRIDGFISDIGAAFVYGDDNRVRETMAKLEGEKDALSNAKQFDALKQKIDDALADSAERLQRIRKVSMSQLGSLAEIANNAAIKDLLATNSDLLSTVPQNHSIIRTTISGGESQRTELPNESVPTSIASIGNVIIVFNQDATALESNDGGNTFRAVTMPKIDGVNVASMATYSSRLYLLDLGNNQVLKLQRLGTGYGTPSRWITDDTINLRDATSIAIDGSIYIGFANGTIKKFTQGKEVAFNSPQLNPAIGSIAKLITNEDMQKLYALDTANNRILVLKKDGTLLEQLSAEGVGTILSFAVSEKNDQLFVLSGSTMFTSALLAE